MPITLYPTTFKYKKNNGQYQSVNAIKGDPGEVTQAELDNALAEHEEYAEETYAKKDGYYSEMSVGTAEQLVSSKFVEDQEPYILRLAGGSADIGNRENLTAIVGGTLAWNQQVRDEASDNTTDFADIVTVDDAVADNAVVKVKIEPVQDLHGYDSPWPGGGGKNKVKPFDTKAINGITLTLTSDGYYKASGTATGTASFTFDTIRLPAGSYVLNGLPSEGQLNVSFRFTIDVGGVNTFVYSNGHTFTLSEDTDIVLTLQFFNGYSAGNAEFKPMIRLASETDATFAPYSNVCPISGWDAVKVTRTGKNLFNLNEYTAAGATVFTEGEYPDSYTGNKHAFYHLHGSAFNEPDALGLIGRKPFGQLTISFYNYSTGNTRVYFHYMDADDWVNHSGNISSAGFRAYTSDANRVCDGVALETTQGRTANFWLGQLQIEIGSTATEYESPLTQTYSITLPSEAGTVYGGELTVNEDGTGQVVVDRAKVNLGAFDFTIQSTPESHIFRAPYQNVIPDILPHANGNMNYGDLCEEYVYKNWTPISSADNGCFSISPIVSDKLVVIDHRFTDTISFQNAVRDVALVYYLATPLTYTLTASQVQTILGTNNVWADAGQLSLTYKGTNEYLTMTDGRKYLTRINGVDSMVLGAGHALIALKGRDNVFDLTQMFGTAAVADYVYGQGAGYFRKWFPNSVYAYNPGELKSVEGLQSHDTVGFNLLNLNDRQVVAYKSRTGKRELAPNQVYIGFAATNNHNPSTVSAWSIASDSVSVTCRSGYGIGITVRVLPGATYYLGVSGSTERIDVSEFDIDGEYIRYQANRGNRTLTTHNECYWLVIVFRPSDNVSAKYTYPILSLVNSGSRNGEYEPYEKHSYPLDSSLTLRGIPKAGANGICWDGDRYLPDGTVERRYGVVDLGSRNWAISSPNVFMTQIAIGKAVSDTNCITNAPYTYIGSRDTAYDKIYKTTVSGGELTLYFRNDSVETVNDFLPTINGKIFIYELATPTSETAQPYHNPQIVDDWGTEEFVTTGLIPVGHTTQYPANLRDKLQHLPDLASSNGIYIVKQTDSEMELMRLPDMPTENGNYRLKLNVASGSPTFSWEVVT